MTESDLSRFARHPAAQATALRGAIVSVNFAVMLGLAMGLGLEAYGRLIVTWGLALIVSGMISLGAPLLILRVSSDVGGMSLRALALQVVAYPIGLAMAGWLILSFLLPSMPWGSVFGLGFAIHVASCLASVMRALGSLHWSALLRDAAPQAALGAAALAVRGDDQTIFIMTVTILFAAVVIAAAWCWRHPASPKLTSCRGSGSKPDMSLWGTTVLGIVLAQVDIVVGGIFMADAQMGAYAILRRIANLVVLPVSVATWVTSVPIAAAHAARDGAALARASAQASGVAMLPGSVLLIGAIMVLMVLGWGSWAVAFVLLTGACFQIVFAATFTVATLCHLAHFAVVARLASVTIYLGLVAVLPAAGALSNAFAYVAALTAGSILLWVVILRRLGIDTSALVLLRSGGEVRWKPS